jgi:hypothetical protein
MKWRAWGYVILTLAVTAGSAGAAEVLTCDTQSAGWDLHEYRCPLTANGAEQRLRFKADFSGGHDDTEASMVMTLDGVPLACSQGSKTSLFGEDGDVSLVCHLALTGPPGSKSLLGATVKFRHAEFVAVELSTL